MASIRSNSSLEKSTFRKAFRLSSSCATELAPIMTDVTSSSFKTQAKDISANVCPRRWAISFSCRAASIFSGVTCERCRKPEERAHEGLFLSFQQPVEIPGVSMVNFMRAAINAKRKYHGMEPMSAGDFLKMMREKRKVVELDSKLANRSVNEGFSGGEKKRNEIFQMAMLAPKLSILDETDSGLDVDALRIVAEGFNKLRTPETSALVITHYQRLLDYLKPDVVHVLLGGRIVKSGGPELAVEIENKGFDWIKAETSAV